MSCYVLTFHSFSIRHFPIRSLPGQTLQRRLNRKGRSPRARIALRTHQGMTGEGKETFRHEHICTSAGGGRSIRSIGAHPGAMARVGSVAGDQDRAATGRVRCGRSAAFHAARVDGESGTMSAGLYSALEAAPSPAVSPESSHGSSEPEPSRDRTIPTRPSTLPRCAFFGARFAELPNPTALAA